MMATLRRIRALIEPWYDWGGMFGWERLDGRGERDGYRFELEWLGLKLMVAVGKTPPPGR